MTLILSCLTREYAIQVSDKRITDMSDGSIRDDARNKGVQFCNQMVFAYSGSAVVQGQNTDVWLTETLSQRGSLEDGMLLARDLLSEAFRKLNSCSRAKRLAFVGVGWVQMEGDEHLSPIRVTLSNSLNANDRWLPEANDVFEYWGMLLKASETFELTALGADVSTRILQAAKRSIASSIRHSANPITIVRILAETIWKVSRFQNTVGRTLLAMIVPKCGVLSTSIGLRGTGLRITEPIETPVFMHILANKFDWNRTLPNFVCGGFTATESSILFGNSTPIERHGSSSSIPKIIVLR